MTLEERSTLVLAFARVLYVNGQSTDQTLAAAGRYGETLGLRGQITPSWAGLQLQAEDGDLRLISAVAAHPTGVNMNRVVPLCGPWGKPADRDGKHHHDLTGATGSDMAIHARSRGLRCRASVAFRCQSSVRGGTPIRKRGGRRNSAARFSSIQRKRLPATILCGAARGRDRRAGGSI